jgi:peroxiredoxin
MGIAVGAPVPARLADAAVLDRDGNSVALGSRWRGAPTLVVFLRHFGCIGCGEQVVELAPRLAEIADLGARTVFVGNGAPNFIAGFVDRYALADKRVDIVTDPTLAAFQAAGLARSWWAVYGPRAMRDALRAWASGVRHGKLAGDGLQQGGTIVVDGSGVVVHYHASRSLGDHSPATDLVEALLGTIVRTREVLV